MLLATIRRYLFVVTKGMKGADVRVYTLPVKRDELAKQTEAFREQLAATRSRFPRVGSQTLRVLFKPAEAQLTWANKSHHRSR